MGSCMEYPDEEATRYIAELKEVVGEIDLQTPYEEEHTRLYGIHDLRDNTELVLFDYGGMWPGNSLMEDQSRNLIRWAQDHPNALVLVTSAFTYRNGIESEMEELGLTKLPNILDASMGIEIPAWWKESN